MTVPQPARPRRRLALVALCLLAAAALTMFELRPVDDEAMSPTLLSGDRVLVNRVAYVARLPFRGEIVVHAEGDGTRLGRVVGIGGDSVELRKGRLFVGGAPVPEAWLGSEAASGRTEGPWRVPGGHVFVLNDRRASAPDSRQLGPLPVSALRGHAVFLLAPSARRGWL